MQQQGLRACAAPHTESVCVHVQCTARQPSSFNVEPTTAVLKCVNDAREQELMAGGKAPTSMDWITFMKWLDNQQSGNARTSSTNASTTMSLDGSLAAGRSVCGGTWSSPSKRVYISHTCHNNCRRKYRTASSVVHVGGRVATTYNEFASNRRVAATSRMSYRTARMHLLMFVGAAAWSAGGWA